MLSALFLANDFRNGVKKDNMETVDEVRDELERIKAVHRRQKSALLSENQLLRDELASLLAHVGALHDKLEASGVDDPVRPDVASVGCQCDLMSAPAASAVILSTSPPPRTDVHLPSERREPVPVNNTQYHSPSSPSPNAPTTTLAGEADRLLLMISKLKLETPKKPP